MSTSLLLAQQRGGLLSPVEDPRTPWTDVDPTNVSTTVTTVDPNADTAVWDSAPDFNEFANDPVTEGGLTSHDLASAIKPRIQGPPIGANNNGSADLFDRVNNGQSSLGTAAAREAAGQTGPGTLNIIEGIEPVWIDGHSFGETYFAAGHAPVQFPAGDYMTATENPDSSTRHALQNSASANARSAVTASQWAAYYKGVTG